MQKKQVKQIYNNKNQQNQQQQRLNEMNCGTGFLQVIWLFILKIFYLIFLILEGFM